jgi:hypothetical protein
MVASVMAKYLMLPQNYMTQFQKFPAKSKHHCNLKMTKLVWQAMQIVCKTDCEKIDKRYSGLHKNYHLLPWY